MVLMLINKGTVKLRKRHKIGISIGEDRINAWPWYSQRTPKDSCVFITRVHS
jgi:hypothetical protein